MKFIRNILNKTISEKSLIDKEIKRVEKIIKKQNPTCLLKDKKSIDKLSDLHIIKNNINKRYKQYIISKLNKFPLNKACSIKFICDKINITQDEFIMVIFRHRYYSHKIIHSKILSGWKVIELKSNLYYERIE